MPTELTRKQFLLTKEESDEIDRRAEEAGLSVSNLTRRLYKLPPLHHGKKKKEAEPKKKKS